MKLIKRGWKNILVDPSVFVNEGKHSIKLHFDMHHGYGVLDKLTNYLQINEFRKYVENIELSKYNVYIKKNNFG